MKTLILSALLLAACNPGTSDTSQAVTEAAHYTYDVAGLPALPSPAVDALGRATTAGGAKLAYGPDGALARATRDGHAIDFITDEQGHRLAKRVDGAFVEAYTDEGVVADTLYMPVKLAGATVGVVHGGQFESVATDARGTLLADGGGVARAAAFGERDRISSFARAVDYAQGGRDADVGVVRMGVRDYDPATHRFTTPDPLFLAHPEKCVDSPVECNLYAYARNAPADFIDTEGTESKIVSLGIAFVNVEIVGKSWSDFSVRADFGVVPQGVNIGTTTKDPAKSELAYKQGYEASAKLGKYTIVSAKAEVKIGTQGISVEAKARALWTEGSIKADSNSDKVKFNADLSQKGVGPIASEMEFKAKAGPTEAVSVTINAQEAVGAWENAKATVEHWFSPEFWNPANVGGHWY
jgi:RHS repeat-associated protein